MSSAGDISRARSLISGSQRKKKQSRRGAVTTTRSSPVAHAIKQTAADCAAIGSSRNNSPWFIGVLLPGSGEKSDRRIGQFERSSPRSSMIASTLKSRASGTWANRDAAHVKIDGGTYGL